MEGVIDAKMLLSAFSFVVTMYFWFVKSRKERPHLEFHQLSDFRAVCRRHPDNKDMQRLCIQQLDSGGVLMVNHSTRQNSLVLFDCFLPTADGVVQGDWGYTGDDKPPWNIGPESSIALSPACFFDVPANYEAPEDLEFEIQFITASGSVFSHTFTKQAPRRADAKQSAQATRRAA